MRTLSFVVLLALVSCGPDSSDADLAMSSEADMPSTDPVLNEDSIASIVIEPAEPRVVVDTTFTLEATALDADGDEVPTTFQWSSSDAAIADVAASGIVIGAAVGTARVTATAAGVTRDVEVTVVPTPAAELIISPTQRQMLRGGTVQITVDLLDANGGLLDASNREINYSTTDEGVVSVTPDGLVTAIGAGEASVVVGVDGLERSAMFTVAASEPQGVEITPSILRLYPGDTAQLNILLTGDDEPGEDRTVVWSSSDPAVATVSTEGLVMAVTKGSATITASAAGQSDTVDVDVVFDFGQVSAGGAHACGLTDGVAWCWGDNAFGQLGHGATEPAPVDTTLRFLRISAGGRHTCAVTTADELYCWGSNEFGQLGDGSNLSTPTPVAAGTPSIAFVSTGPEHTCAITTNDEGYCWGNGADGRLGDGGTASESTPVFIGNYTGVSAGARHTCATKNGVGGDCWGDNDNGQLGRNLSSDFEASPGPITGGYDFSSINLGGEHGCGVTIVGTAACWGRNGSGQVGEGTNTTRLTPILLPASTTLTRLTTGGSHSCGLSATSEAYCWGEGDDGRLGTGSTIDEANAKAVIGGLQFSQISGGSDFTCAVTILGDVYCWGAVYGPEPAALF